MISSPSLPIRTLRRQRTIVLRPEGELDLSTCDALVAAARRAARTRPARIEVDASALRFVDVAGMRAVMETRRVARAAGARFGLVHPSDAMRRVLALR